MKLRAGVFITRTCLTAIGLIMLAGDVSSNPGPTYGSNKEIHAVNCSFSSWDGISDGSRSLGKVEDCILVSEGDNYYCDPHSHFDIKLGDKGLRYGSWNINRLTMTKFDQIKLFLLKRDVPQIDILSLNETFLKQSTLDSLFEVSGFTMYRRDRKGIKKGGGVMVFVNDELTHKRRTDLEDSELEAVWLEVCSFKFKRSTLFAAIYRPPSHAKEMDENIVKVFEAIYPLNKEIIIMGDFNIDFHKQTFKRHRAIKALSSMEFKQLVNK